MAGLALLLASCSDPNKLTEERIAEVVSKKVRFNSCFQFFGEGSNFAEASVNGQRMDMQDFLQKNEPFPVTVPIGGMDNFNGPRFQEFENAGLLSSKVQSTQTGMIGGPVEFRTYDLTEFGRAFYHVGEKRVFRDSPVMKNPLFCVGRGQVAEVINFTVPAEGSNTTRVTFRWNTVDERGSAIETVPSQPWSNIASIRSDRLALEGEGSAVLTLTNNGWELLE